ncbi:hypothetical protein LCGC14_2514540 [marine sediment metagenome]|uniref:Periplasmic heavy metal sensor n=1 Tax=marine sediment metagenome TaxID=412755 RepID=A0A0F9DRH7_9ZZZZ
MRTRGAILVAVLLIVSLAFHAAFAVGFLKARGELDAPRTFRQRAAIIAKQLQLDEKQLTAFEAVLDEKEQLRDSRSAQREAFMAEMMKDTPDQKGLDEYVAGPSAIKYRLSRLAIMRKIIAILRPSQREKLMQIVKKRHSPPKR